MKTDYTMEQIHGKIWGTWFAEWLQELAEPYNPDAGAELWTVPAETIAEAGFPEQYLIDMGWDYNAETDCYELNEITSEILGE